MPKKGFKFSPESIEKLKKAQSGKNNGMYGKKHSQHTINLIRKKALGRKLSNNTLENMRKAQLGRKHSEKTKLKISLSHKGIRFTEEHKRNMSLAVSGSKHPFWGKVRDVSTRQKISISKIGKQRNPFSKEWKEKIGLSSKGSKSHFWAGGTIWKRDCKKMKELSLEINRKYGSICQNCGKKEGKNLAVHHIDYNPNNHSPDNLTLLCNSCHSKTNDKRLFWENFFKSKKGGF